MGNDGARRGDIDVVRPLLLLPVMTTDASSADFASRLASLVPGEALARLLTAGTAEGRRMTGLKDADSGRYLLVDDAFAAFIGRAPVGIVGRSDAELFDGVLATSLRAADHTALARDGVLVSGHVFEWQGVRREFSVLRVAATAAGGGARLVCAVWIDEGEARRASIQLEAALRQLEQQQRANESLRRELADQALRDPASGLYTRTHFEDQLRREVDLSTREHREFALVFIELDPSSDRVAALGAAAKARILEAMGRLLRSGTRAMDSSCRLDDRRFAVLLSGVGLATAHTRMEGLRRQCAAQIVVLDGQELGFTVSMGVASFPHTAHSQDELQSACDGALAEARRRGGNHVTLASIRFES